MTLMLHVPKSTSLGMCSESISLSGITKGTENTQVKAAGPLCDNDVLAKCFPAPSFETLIFVAQ